jgi:hypothetical protein
MTKENIMSTTTIDLQANTSASKLVINGAIAGLAGGAVFGMMMGMIQMIFVIEQTQWLSLMGHIIYGVVTALVFIPLVKRS